MLYPQTDVYEYFTNLGFDFKDKKVLDFGGNQGGLLAGSKGAIKEEDYTCVDIDKEPIEVGKKRFPQAEWIWYDHHNPVYNSDSQYLNYPEIEEKYDLIIAYSVFSHSTAIDLAILLIFLHERLKPRGQILFTWCDVGNERCVKWFIKEISKDFKTVDVPKAQFYCYLCDNKIRTFPPKKLKYFVTFYNKEWLLSYLQEYKPINFIVGKGSFQDLMIINARNE